MMDMHSSNQYLKESRKEYLKTKLKKTKAQTFIGTAGAEFGDIFKCSTR